MQVTKRFIRRAELVAKVGLGATTIFHLERAGKFPQHILLTPRVAVWDEAKVDAWMREQMARAVGAGARFPKKKRPEG